MRTFAAQKIFISALMLTFEAYNKFMLSMKHTHYPFTKKDLTTLPA